MTKNNALETSQNILGLLRTIHRNIVRNLDILHKTELSPQQLHALAIIGDNGKITMSTLAKEMLILKQQLTPIVDNLIKNNYIQKEHDTQDRRNINLSLTFMGENFITEHTKQILATINSKIDVLTPQKLSDLDHSVTKLQKIFNEIF